MKSTGASSEEIARKSRSNLAFALACLPKERRRDMVSFYAYCRIVDDIADADDRPVEERRAELGRWRHAVLNQGEGVEDPVLSEVVKLPQKYAFTPEWLAEVIDERDREGSSLAGIWRKHRLTCPDRGEWGAYLLGALPATRMLYLRFHLETVGCRICQANLEDLQGKAAPSPAAHDRRRRCFESSLRSLPCPLPSAEAE